MPANNNPPTDQEQYFIDNTNLVYAHETGYDFILNRDHQNDLFVEVMEFKDRLTEDPRLKFRIRMGAWTKAKYADIIIGQLKDSIVFGLVEPINEYLMAGVTERQLELSYESRRSSHHKGRGTALRRPSPLIRGGILHTTNSSGIGSLETEICRIYDSYY